MQCSTSRMYTKSGRELEAIMLVIVGCLLKPRSSTARYNSCSTHNCAMPAQQQQSGPNISQLTPELQSQWDHDKNAHLGNIVIKQHSGRKVYWICRKCPDGLPHTWEAAVDQRTRSRGCPFCSGHKLCPHNSLANAAPQVAREWDTAKNPGSPHDYTAGNGYKPHWLCTKCGHGWQTSIVNRVKMGSGCPQCARKKRRLPTVASSPGSTKQYWDAQRNAEQGLDPDVVTIGSNRRANFVCNRCPQLQAHMWTARVNNVFRGTGCPYCSGTRVCKCNSLQTLRPDLAAEWCYALNKGTPNDYTAKSNVEVWWQTSERGEWKETLNTRFYN